MAIAISRGYILPFFRKPKLSVQIPRSTYFSFVKLCILLNFSSSQRYLPHGISDHRLISISGTLCMSSVLFSFETHFSIPSTIISRFIPKLQKGIKTYRILRKATNNGLQLNSSGVIWNQPRTATKYFRRITTNTPEGLRNRAIKVVLLYAS